MAGKAKYTDKQKARFIKKFKSLRDKGFSVEESTTMIGGPSYNSIIYWMQLNNPPEGEATIEIHQPEPKVKYAPRKSKPKPSNRLAVVIGNPQEVAAVLMEMGL